MQAYLKNYRQAPRKVRRVASLIRGKGVSEALTELNFVPKRAADPIRKLLASASANAKIQEATPENLYIKSITVDKGVTMKRSMPRSRGMANPIHKHMSHVKIVLAPLSEKKTKAKNKK